jgi:type I restriction enzyme S subunit
MNATELLVMYDRVADAPDAVGKLRSFVLDLAVRGKLVEQDPRPVLQGTQGAFAPGSSDEAFEIPDGWRWATLSELGTLRGGGTPSKARPDFWGGTIPWVSPKDMKRDYLASAQMSVTESALAGSAANLIPAGSVLFVVRGMILAHSFPVGIGTVPLTINQDMKALVLAAPEQGEYLLRALKGMKAFMLKRVQRSSHGTCRLEGSDYKDFSVPIPPLAEQHRIVAKVDELMALCDQLEAARVVREAARDRLAAASLARLNAPDPDTFQSDARFALSVLPALSARPDQVKQLRQTILNLAVRGKLVPQAPTTKASQVSTTSQLGRPADIPSSWRFEKLESLLSEDTRNGYSRRPDDAPNGTPILRISAGTVRRDGVVAEEEHKLISGIDQAVREQYGVRAGDLLACRFNGNKSFVGRFTLFEDYLQLRPIYPDKLIRVRVDQSKVLATFIRHAGESDLIRSEIEAQCATTVGNWGISASNLKSIHFPVPPLAEQHHLVAKVDELMALCDQLQASLEAGESIQSRLLEALLHQWLEPGCNVAA